MVAPYPETDQRGVAELRRDLRREVDALVPALAQSSRPGEFGHAFYELAVRMAAHLTRRLDQTPRRDTIAFFDALDIPAAAPRAAEAPLVFTLSEKRDDPVEAPEGLQVGADADGEEVTFETRNKLAITPARLVHLVAADVGNDTIELAPANVLAAAPAPGPFPQYTFATFANADSKTIQVTPVTGLEQGDLIRIDQSVYRIEKIEQDLCTIEPKLKAAADTGTPITKVVQFDAFTLLDIQAHQVFIAHDELLNLKEPANITLKAEPTGVTRRLAAMDIALYIWDTRDKNPSQETDQQKPGDKDGGKLIAPSGEPGAGAPEANDVKKETDWHELTRTGATDEVLTFSKWWTGEVEKLEINGQKSRWLKLVLRDKIPDQAGIGARVNTLKMKISSAGTPEGTKSKSAGQKDAGQNNNPDNKDAPKPDAPGSKTIQRAFYNNTPLPRATSFLPFGPEPQRFDTFSIAAPEAFSKKGADVTLDVTLVDATLVTLSLLRASAPSPPRAYGVGHNGRLQALAFEQGDVRWQEIKSPRVPASASADDQGETFARLSRVHAVQAIELPGSQSSDLVIGYDEKGRFWAQTVGYSISAGFEAKGWRLLPTAINAADVREFCLVETARVGTDTVLAFLLAVDKEGVQRLRLINDAPEKGAVWTPLILAANSEKPNPSGKASLVQATLLSASSPTSQIVLIDTDGVLWSARIGSADPDVTWTRLGQRFFSPSTRPAAAVVQDVLTVVAAAKEKEADKHYTPYVVQKTGNGDAQETKLAAGDFVPFVGSPLLLLPIGATNDFRIAALGEKDKRQVAAVWDDDASWTDEGRTLFLPLPGEPNATRTPKGILYKHPSASGDYWLVVASSKEQVAQTLLSGGGVQDVQITSLYDAFPMPAKLPPEESPEHVVIRGPGTQRLVLPIVPAAQVTADDKRFHACAHNTAVQTGRRFLLLSEKEHFAAGKRHSPQIVRLDPQDLEDSSDANSQPITKVDDIILVVEGGAFSPYRITEVKKEAGEWFARVRRNLPTSPADPLPYVTTRVVDRGTVAQKNVGTIAKLQQAHAAERLIVETDDGETIGQSVIGMSGQLLLLEGAWDSAPTISSITRAYAVTRSSVSPWTLGQLKRGYQNPELSWEYFDGRGWKRLRIATDETDNLAAGGKIRFRVPDDLSQTDVAGQQDYWIRARLIGGDYGHAKYVVTTVTGSGQPPSQTQTITVDTSDLHPPEILSIEAEFVIEKAVPPEIVLVDNNGGILNQTQAAAEENATFELFEGLRALDRFKADRSLAGRVLFLGFTKPFKVSQLVLYADAEEQDGEGALEAAVLTQQGWRDVQTTDKTVGFRRRGIVRISITEEPVRALLFGQELYWVRLRLKSDEAAARAWAPRIKGLFVNAVLAEQAKTITQEVLGSSDGGPHQSYPLGGKPVLLRDGLGSEPAGPPDVEIRVRESLSDEDRNALAASVKGVEAVVKPPDIPGEWVLWQRTDSFLGHDGDARVFKLDPGLGMVHFGDNRSGKIPPAGRDGIRAFRYRQGGGAAGNVAAYAIKNLKTALESVEAVVNPVEAAGGMDAPSVDQVIATAPARLRHAKRALAAADMEALAVASSPDVVRARLVMPSEPGGDMRLAVAIRGGDPCPQPPLARREALAAYIIEQAAGSLQADALKVVPPDYVPVKVEVELLAVSAETVAGVESEARKRLVKFLHPTDGGPQGAGWPFARRIWPSDVDRALAGIDGLDRVAAVAVSPAESERDFDNLSRTAMVCAAKDGIVVQVRPGETA